MAEERRIIKVKFKSKDAKIAIAWQEKQEGVWNDFSLECAGSPEPEFTKCLKSLSLAALEIAELPDKYLERLNVTGVSFSFSGEKEVMGASLIAVLQLLKSDAGLNLVTPHKASGSYNDSPPVENRMLPKDSIPILRALQKHALRYIDGHRAQGDLLKDDK